MIKVVNNGTTIDISDENGTINVTSIKKSQILSVGMYFQENATNGLGGSPYGYGKRTPGRTTKTIIRLTMLGELTYSFDCDEVANQLTWQGCTLAALLQAQSDIQSWL